MGRKCASGPSFARVSTRAPIAPQAEEVVTKAVRDEILDPQGDEMRCKMECLVTVKCRYSQCKTDDVVFSVEFG